ncbi:unnamed protein product, partial [Cuscuta campestris]
MHSHLPTFIYLFANGPKLLLPGLPLVLARSQP